MLAKVVWRHVTRPLVRCRVLRQHNDVLLASNGGSGGCGGARGGDKGFDGPHNNGGDGAGGHTFAIPVCMYQQLYVVAGGQVNSHLLAAGHWGGCGLPA